MKVTILDSEGVTLVLLMEVEDSCRRDGIRLPIQPRIRDLLREDFDPLSPPFVRETLATFERVRGDGVAVFRRVEP